MELQLDEPEPEPGTEKKIIGITGGIGSGKTTASGFIEEAGYPVYYSDDRAKTIVNDDAELKRKIIELLGSNAYDPEGKYNRAFVSRTVFENDDLLRKLNALIHPAVRRDFESWVIAQPTAVVFKETALLFELGLEKDCFRSLLITADENCRIKRVMDRDDKTYREVETIIQKQMPEKEKIKLADFVIYNNDDVETLKADTLDVLEQLFSFEEKSQII